MEFKDRNRYYDVRTDGRKTLTEVLDEFELNTWQPKLVPDKESADRYRIERDDNSLVLFSKKAFKSTFEPFTNDRIYRLGNALLQSNSNLEMTHVASLGYGEQLLIKSRFVGNSFYSDIKGIGKLEPSVMFLFNLSRPTAKLAFSYKQLICDNQLPGLASNPLANVFELPSKASDEEIIASCDLLSGYAQENIEEMILFLERLAKTLATTKTIHTIFSLVFGVPNMEEERPNLLENLMNRYDNAPNACPNTLLGAINAITNYYVDFDYNIQQRYMSEYISSISMNKAKKAMKLCEEALKFPNPNDYFEAIA